MIVGAVGIVVRIGRVGNGIKSGSIGTSVSTLVCVIVGASGIENVTDDVTVDEIVDELVVVSLSVVAVIIGGVGIVINLVVELMHSEFPVFLMHDDEFSSKIHPMGHGRSIK